MLWQGDFRKDPLLKIEAYRIALVKSAVIAASSGYGGVNPLKSFLQNGKRIYQVANLRDELVVRKICANIKHIARPQSMSRNAIVANLSQLLADGSTSVDSHTLSVLATSHPFKSSRAEIVRGLIQMGATCEYAAVASPR